MKNIKVDRVDVIENSALQDAEDFVIDYTTNQIIVATKSDIVFLCNEEIINKVNWEEHRGDAGLISFAHRTFGGNQIVAIFDNGKALILEDGEIIVLDMVDSFDCDTISAAWSLDEQFIAIADKSNLSLFDSSFVPISERKLQFEDEDMKENAVNVGWGSEETQFRGSAGKFKKEELPKATIQQKKLKTSIHWRYDSSFVAVSYSPQPDTRILSLYDQNGNALSKMNCRNGLFLSNCFAIKPNANLICSASLNKDSNDGLTFFERNGETRNGYKLNWRHKNRRTIEQILWNSSGTLLCLVTNYDNYRYVEIWKMSNFEFLLKYSWKVGQEEITVKWSDANENQLEVMMEGKITFIQFSLSLSYSQFLGLNLNVASDDIRVTNLSQRIVPPPLCDFSIETSDLALITSSAKYIHVFTHDFKIISYEPLDKSFNIINELQINWNFGNSVFCGFVFQEKTNSFYLWCKCSKNDVIYKIDSTNGTCEKILNETGIGWIGINPKHDDVEYGKYCGDFYSLDNSSCLFKIEPFENIQVQFSGEFHIILTNDLNVYIDSRKVATNITSIMTRDLEVLAIDLDSKLKFIDVKTKELLNDVRDVEQGSELVAANNQSTCVVLQAHRGNLEGIHPRKFVMRRIEKYLESNKYIEAFKWMKKYRIEMSFGMNSTGFIENVPLWIDEIKDVQLIEQLIIACTIRDEIKGNELCNVLYEEIGKIADSNRKSFLFPILLTALLRCSPIRVNDALKEIVEHSQKIDGDKDVFKRNMLHHMSFFVPTKTLFNCALSTYDLKLSKEVAEATNADPKEYLPILNSLQSISNVLERKYQIDVLRESWTDALVDLIQLDSEDVENSGWWQKAKELINNEKLHQICVIVSKGSKRYKECCELYAEELERKNNYKEAAIVYEMACNIEKTLKCLENSRDIESLISAARRLKISEGKLKLSAIKMSTIFNESGMFRECAQAMRLAGGKNKQIVDVLCKGNEWKLALNQLENGFDHKDSDDWRLLHEHAKNRLEMIEVELKKNYNEFEKYQNRLEVVRNTKIGKIEMFHRGEIDDLRDDVSMISSISSRSGSSKISMASSARRRKQIEKKKSSLKEGGEYEDSALLNALASIYKWTENIRKEMACLVPVLLCVGELDCGVKVKNEIEAFSDKILKQRNSIWPDQLLIHHLPGPLHSLFEGVTDIQSIPTYPIMRVEPELIKPDCVFQQMFP